MKRILSAVLVILMVFSCITALAESSISVVIDGEAKTFDVMPVEENGRVLVPMRGIFEELGAEVSWDDVTWTVTAKKEDTKVILHVGGKTARVNKEDVELDVPAKIIDGRTFVPVRFVAETLECQVNWVQETSTVEIKKPEKTQLQKMLDGKKIIFIGNSHIYYGRTVPSVNVKYYTEEKRLNSKGIFYELCKANGIDISVTNWTFANHGLRSLFGAPCNVKNSACEGVNHEEYLTDRYYDYVVVTPGVGKASEEGIVEDMETITKFFRDANPDVKFILLGCASALGVNANDTPYPGVTTYYKTLEEKGWTIADWGNLVKDIIEGKATVPGGKETYNKNSFIIKDGYHPNLLSGYITTLFTYCAITGESAVGQPYGFFFDETLAPTIDVPGYVDYYYVNGDADSNFPEVINSPDDIKGIQMLVDEYLKAKDYLNY